MKTLATSLVAVVVLAVSACSSDTTEPESATPPASSEEAGPEYVAEVESTVDRLMRDNAIPGAVIQISSPDRGDWTGTFGTSTLDTDDPISADDHFRIGSNTKTMTVTAILQLVQEGRVSLEDPISKYIDGVPNGDTITIAQLAEMRSGLYSYTFDPEFNATLDREPEKVWTQEELLQIAFSRPVNFPPGEQFEYSNTNTVLLGLVIEELTGMPVADAFDERIFAPLELGNTSFPAIEDSSIPDPHPRGYMFGTNVSTIDTFELPDDQQAAALAGTLKPNDVTDDNPSWAWTAGAAISTVDDMTTYVKALVGGGLLDEQMQNTRLDSVQSVGGGTAGYGLGMAQFGPLLGHDGQLPGFMTFMGHDPDTDLTIVIATNLSTVPSGEGSALTLVKGILPIFYGSDYQAPSDPARAPGAEESTPVPTPGG
ncbi:MULTISPECIES: serine hydrolase domain-containing protein [Rhodococcus]|uniref:serine hydrolase domain-containing protein n=1 Tax=Rhodococcus TaxID=1827 RepID=UPI00030A8017|nr:MULTISPECIES: serine hydrolase domain-containing protein [Rhodococcus]AWZ24421.1 D-alanyl-D-alanine carboxypeptidase [Rhodococcus pyridinivorans]MCD2116692.1 beta-lactamase family protein [Rhodococcus pyridinivorans]MCZ4625364.1 serine hydrolase [Rhodococcus pyridinivorans]MCZ4646574.1 serine hydrolase [Rhodococcus pyridinivorans]MDJ0482412.1 serine hydrolase domain-containing protein [Rhodococcus pyridinivorans]